MKKIKGTEVRVYRGVAIYPQEQPSHSGLRYYSPSPTSSSYLRSDTLEGMKRLIREALAKPRLIHEPLAKPNN